MILLVCFIRNMTLDLDKKEIPVKIEFKIKSVLGTLYTPLMAAKSAKLAIEMLIF